MPGYDKYPAHGVPFHGEFSSVDASSGVLLTEASRRFSLFIAGTTAATTLAASDQVLVTELYSATSNTSIVTIYEGSDVTPAAGETIAILRQTTVGQSVTFNTPHYCQAGCYPKVVNSTTQIVDVVIRGVIKLGV